MSMMLYIKAQDQWLLILQDHAYENSIRKNEDKTK